MRVRAALLAAAVLLAGATAERAPAKSFSLPAADVTARVLPDGSLAVEEDITFSFDGAFTGGFREIPLREGETIDGISVQEGRRPYRPGASAELGSSGDPGTFGVAELEGAVRVVWHYAAVSQARTFTIRYRLRGLVVAHDDVVDVNLQVWGDEWRTGLGQLRATLLLPGGAPPGRSFRAWGHPVHVRGDVALTAGRVNLRALAVPAGQFVELRAVFPRRLLATTAGARVEPGRALPQILAEEREDASGYERDRDRIAGALDHVGRTLLLLLALAFGPALLVLLAIYLIYGRERPAAYDREYEQEPPSALEPALVPPLLRQSPRVGALEFTATLFDLVRRGHYAAKPITTERSTFAGLRHQTIADLELSRGDPVPLAPFERPVAEVVDAVLEGGSHALSRFRDRIDDDRKGNSERSRSSRTASPPRCASGAGSRAAARRSPSPWRRSHCCPRCSSGAGSTGSGRSHRGGATSCSSYSAWLPPRTRWRSPSPP